jgi:hypothetical protein
MGRSFCGTGRLTCFASRTNPPQEQQAKNGEHTPLSSPCFCEEVLISSWQLSLGQQGMIDPASTTIDNRVMIQFFTQQM